MLSLNLWQAETLPASSVAPLQPASLPLTAQKDPPCALFSQVSSLETDISILTSDNNRLLAQLHDLKSLLKRVSQENAIGNARNSSVNVSHRQTQLKAALVNRKTGLKVAEKSAGHLERMAGLWVELGLN